MYQVRSVRRGVAVGVLLSGGILAGCGATGPATAATQPKSNNNTSVAQAVERDGYGKILVTSTGATLYAYSPDGPNHPTCTQGCAGIWPPYTLPNGTKLPQSIKGLGFVSLPNGREQLTLDEHPLYRYSGDTKGTVNGEGIGGIWYVVNTSGQKVTAKLSATHSTTPTTAANSYSY